MKKNKVCIVTPFHKQKLNDYEKLSLKTINKNFKDEKKYLVTFKDNNIKIPNYTNIFFDKKYFLNIRTYTILCNSLSFYQKFRDFDYILICHFDVIVLKNNLKTFINSSLSYIGAPAGKKNPFDRTRKKLWARRFFCNGGFSLRKVSDFINVLESSKISFPFNYYTIYECSKSGFFPFFSLLRKTKNHNFSNKGEYFAQNLNLHEDTFWSYFATIFYDEYKLPSLSETTNFCFDGDPFFFYKKNYFKLPMALHGHYNYIEFLKKIGKESLLK